MEFCPEAGLAAVNCVTKSQIHQVKQAFRGFQPIRGGAGNAEKPVSNGRPACKAEKQVRESGAYET